MQYLLVLILYYRELQKKSIADRVKLREQKLDITNKKTPKKTMNCLKNTLIIQTQTL